ncbi:hypothetical protein ABPG74_000364 [Tetrahymena malaccensis]
MNKILVFVPLLLLIGVGVVFIQQSNPNLLDDDYVTLTQYGDCKSLVKFNKCQEDIPTQHVMSSYIRQLVPKNPYCKYFYDYLDSIQESKDYDHALLNKDQFYEKCYASDEVRDIANSDECFFTTYYAPKILLCGGLDKYAYPPYTSFDVKQ